MNNNAINSLVSINTSNSILCHFSVRTSGELKRVLENRKAQHVCNILAILINILFN